MVVFTCNHCGESLQKPRVEKHYAFQCRRAKALTCVDCLKDFNDEEYNIHTKCVTEEERYSAKGSIPGGIVKKGEVKQESWTEMIKSIVEQETNLQPSLRKLFHTISNYSNVPRKKIKFINFLKNSLGGLVNFNDIEAAWDLIEKFKNEQSKSCDIQGNNDDAMHADQKVEAVSVKKRKSDGLGTEIKNKKKKKKGLDAENKNNGVKHKESVTEDAKVTGDNELAKFSFKTAILDILSSKGSISCKKLQKKVLNLYLTKTGDAECTEKVIKKYNKKLNKMDNVVINDNIVSLT